VYGEEDLDRSCELEAWLVRGRMVMLTAKTTESVVDDTGKECGTEEN
jgi:hypothetical protein